MHIKNKFFVILILVFIQTANAKSDLSNLPPCEQACSGKVNLEVVQCHIWLEGNTYDTEHVCCLVGKDNRMDDFAFHGNDESPQSVCDRWKNVIYQDECAVENEKMQCRLFENAIW